MSKKIPKTSFKLIFITILMFFLKSTTLSAHENTPPKMTTIKESYQYRYLQSRTWKKTNSHIFKQQSYDSSGKQTDEQISWKMEPNKLIFYDTIRSSQQTEAYIFNGLSSNPIISIISHSSEEATAIIDFNNTLNQQINTIYQSSPHGDHIQTHIIYHHDEIYNTLPHLTRDKSSTRYPKKNRYTDYDGWFDRQLTNAPDNFYTAYIENNASINPQGGTNPSGITLDRLAELTKEHNRTLHLFYLIN
ncbi:hypothetical protein [Candidatus Phytoplasma pruni]|uniref:Uncharacterized protein n=1 Tax=Candidatus Phytoplasma pruni TaxID=479893 RepID=A0A851HJY4_9MOLU|nr:hypothetical protein [Candidatus Phytoplasma pruni]NWN45749.1 hypothetical protein [Candidatus Phytoplasma pruni]